MNAQFIIASDSFTKKQLLEKGFTLLNENNDKAIFINDSNIMFDKKGLKYAYTNTLHF